VLRGWALHVVHPTTPILRQNFGSSQETGQHSEAEGGSEDENAYASGTERCKHGNLANNLRRRIVGRKYTLSGRESRIESGACGEMEPTIQVNGETRPAIAGGNVIDLLRELGLDDGRVAIERNLEILPRQKWSETLVVAGDRYEIVHFVGGG
jgi:sulfur carrier protein